MSAEPEVSLLLGSPQTLDCNRVCLSELEFAADFSLKMSQTTQCTVSSSVPLLYDPETFAQFVYLLKKKQIINALGPDLITEAECKQKFLIG